VWLVLNALIQSGSSQFEASIAASPRQNAGYGREYALTPPPAEITFKVFIRNVN
jgi:hypothetical protein